MFSRNVFCGATSPLRPPAMVILPAAPGWWGGASRHGSSRQLQAGRGARARRRLQAPHAPPRGPGRARAAAPARCPWRPPRACLPAARLAVHSRGARLAAAASGWAEGAAAGLPAPPAECVPPPACGRASGGSRGGPGTRGRGAAAPSGHRRETRARRALSRPGKVTASLGRGGVSQSPGTAGAPRAARFQSLTHERGPALGSEASVCVCPSSSNLSPRRTNLALGVVAVQGVSFLLHVSGSTLRFC